MSKNLNEMTLEELWELFPISLVKHRDEWTNFYNDEREFLKNTLRQFPVKISHIGSTAIKDIYAKNIVDILIELPTDYNLKSLCSLLVNNGYICMSETDNRISLNKGYTPQGFAEKVFHLHLRYDGDNAEIYFCKYLNEFPTLAKEYEQLKLSLAQKYEHDRDAYTFAKTDFVSRVTKKAIEFYLK